MQQAATNGHASAIIPFSLATRRGSAFRTTHFGGPLWDKLFLVIGQQPERCFAMT